MTRELILNFVRWVIALGTAATLARQCRRPAWLPGRLIALQMNVTHRALTTWALSRLTIGENFTILDVGCGGGRTIDRLASIAANGKVYGVDYAPASVATARRTNATRIAEGKVQVRDASVSALPFDADTFDLVTAVETHYYWPDLPRDVHEILRVLKPGGQLAIVAETYRGRRMDWLYRPAMTLLGASYLTPAEHRELLTNAGYRDVDVIEQPKQGWICAMGRKPGDG